MNEQEFIGWLVIGGGAVIALIVTVTKPLLNVHRQLVELNANQKQIIEQNKIRDDRITLHGKEIETNQRDLIEVKHELANHETRLQSLES